MPSLLTRILQPLLFVAIFVHFLVAGALTLYEWPRRAIWGRRFHIGWNGRTPAQLCEAAPYRFLRRPIYAIFMLTFLAELVALPSLVTLAVFVCNGALFLHAALTDERSLANSPIAAAYADYRGGTGMFLPRLTG